jgi:hypothetical protein
MHLRSYWVNRKALEKLTYGAFFIISVKGAREALFLAIEIW